MIFPYRIVLLRPHKTASHNLHLCLSAGLDPAAICPYPFASQYRQHGTRLDAYSYHWPHMTWAECMALSGADGCHIVIALRDPQARLLSAYNFFREVAERVPLASQHSLHHALRHRAFDPDSLRADATVAAHLDNHLTRFLFGRHPNDVNRRAELPMAHSPAPQAAVAALHRVLARPRTTLVDLAAGLIAGAPLPRPSARNIDNPNPGRKRYVSAETLTPAQHALLQEWTRSDRALYDLFRSRARPLGLST